MATKLLSACRPSVVSAALSLSVADKTLSPAALFEVDVTTGTTQRMSALAVGFGGAVVSSVSHRVKHVLRLGAVPKVGESVVGRIVVGVQRFHSNWTRTDEGFKHQLVNESVCLLGSIASPWGGGHVHDKPCPGTALTQVLHISGWGRV